jgi:hypothetical protein
MIDACLDFLIGCVHRNQTRPFTLNRACYTVCLNCGKELPYSWKAMRPLKRRERAKESYQACDEVSAAA